MKSHTEFCLSRGETVNILPYIKINELILPTATFSDT